MAELNPDDAAAALMGMSRQQYDSMGDLKTDQPRFPLNYRKMLEHGAFRVTQPGSGAAPTDKQPGFLQNNDPNQWSIVSKFNDAASNADPYGGTNAVLWRKRHKPFSGGDLNFRIKTGNVSGLMTTPACIPYVRWIKTWPRYAQSLPFDPSATKSLPRSASMSAS